MTVVVQNELQPGRVLTDVLALAQHDAVSLKIAVAYATRGGCEMLLPRLQAQVGTQSWLRIPKTFIVSFDYGLTEPSALELLRSVPNSLLLVADSSVLSRPALRPLRAYHPKLYLVDYDGHCACFIGSANLTVRALSVNTEAGVTTTLSREDGVDIWTDLLEGTEAVTDAILDAYDAARRQIPDEQRTESTWHPPARPATRVGTLLDAIDAGFEPAAWSSFWVQAGSMTSGGSRSQLELPRGGNRFFGYQFSDYDEDHATIGQLTLSHGQQRWADRPLTWHGNNRMERLNLPTAAEGGLRYPRTIIQFRRAAGGFAIDVAPENTTLAQSWISASAQGGSLFRLGRNSPRLCGFF